MKRSCYYLSYMLCTSIVLKSNLPFDHDSPVMRQFEPLESSVSRLRNIQGNLLRRRVVLLSSSSILTSKDI